MNLFQYLLPDGFDPPRAIRSRTRQHRTIPPGFVRTSRSRKVDFPQAIPPVIPKTGMKTFEQGLQNDRPNEEDLKEKLAARVGPLIHPSRPSLLSKTGAFDGRRRKLLRKAQRFDDLFRILIQPHRPAFRIH